MSDNEAQQRSRRSALSILSLLQKMQVSSILSGAVAFPEDTGILDSQWSGS